MFPSHEVPAAVSMVEPDVGFEAVRHESAASTGWPAGRSPNIAPTPATTAFEARSMIAGIRTCYGPDPVRTILRDGAGWSPPFTEGAVTERAVPEED